MELQPEPSLALRCALCHRLVSEEELKGQSDSREEIRDDSEQEALEGQEESWLSRTTELSSLVVIDGALCVAPNIPEFDVEELKR